MVNDRMANSVHPDETTHYGCLNCVYMFAKLFICGLQSWKG